MFICLLSTFKLTAAHKKVALKNNPPPPSQPAKSVIDAQVSRAIIDGTKVTIGRTAYPEVFENSKQLFREPTKIEVYYEIPILEKSSMKGKSAAHLAVPLINHLFT
jgi:hypothetical protein